MFYELQSCLAKVTSLFKQFVGPIQLLAAVTSILIASGCATVDPQVVQAQTRGKSIAVASALGSNLELKWVGTTIFNIEQGTVAVPAWKIDDMVVNAAGSALLATQRYAAVNTFTNINRVGDDIPILPPGSQADYLLLIERWHGGDPMFGTNQSFEGVGIAQRSFMGLEPRARAYISVHAELFDLSAGKSMGALSPFEHWQIASKLKSGGGFNFKEDKAPVPIIEDRDLADLQQPITARLTKVVEDILGNMGLR